MQLGLSEFKPQISVKQNLFPQKAHTVFIAAVRYLTPPSPHQRQQIP
jgi:hypothetical protein